MQYNISKCNHHNKDKQGAKNEFYVPFLPGRSCSIENVELIKCIAAAVSVELIMR